MDITLERILFEMKQQGKKQFELTDFLGISHNCFGNWKAGLNKSYLKYLHAIADYLCVSVEYLKGETNIKTTAPSLDSDKSLMFALWGGDQDIVDEEMLEDVKDFAKLLAEKKKRKMEQSK